MTKPAPPRISLRQIAAWLGPRDRRLVFLGAALAFTLAGHWQGWAQGAASALLGGLTAAITLIDRRHFRIPDLLSLPLIPLGLIAAYMADDPVLPRLLAMVAVGAVLAVLQRAFAALRGKSGLGSGDIKLVVAAAAWLAPDMLPTFLLAAAGTGLVEGLLRRNGLEKRIAFGAHLAPWLVIFVFLSGNLSKDLI